MKKIMMKIYSDGGARGNPGPAACAFIVIKNDQIIFKHSYYLGETTNNVAEYEGLLRALKWLSKNFIGKKNLVINFYLDSQLIVSQLNGKYKIKNVNLISLAKKIKEIEKKFSGKIFYHFITREKNKMADKLLNDVLDEKL